MRRMELEEKRRKFPRSFFGKKDLAGLISSLMKRLCRAGAEPIPLRCIPVRCNSLHHGHRRVHAVLQMMHSACRRLAAFAIVGLASKLSRKVTAAKIVCEDDIQECMEALPDLCARTTLPAV